ncbi:unnamed protein product [Arabidopsis halleri]
MEAKSKKAGASRLCCLLLVAYFGVIMCVLKIYRECFYEVFEEETHQVIVQNCDCYIAFYSFDGFFIFLFQYGLPRQIVSYKDLYGWTMDDIVKNDRFEEQLHLFVVYSVYSCVIESRYWT